MYGGELSHTPAYVGFSYCMIPTYTGMLAGISASKTQATGHLRPVRVCDRIFFSVRLTLVNLLTTWKPLVGSRAEGQPRPC
jgi:hypothetical protein